MKHYFRENGMPSKRKKTHPSKKDSLSSPIYQPGQNPEIDALFTAFLIENHLDHFTHPDHAATPEQIRFMVYLEEDERYFPCSDRMLQAILGKKESNFLKQQYNDVYSRIIDLIHRQIDNPDQKQFLESLITIKFKHETRDEIMLPSRLEKRLIRIFMNRTQIKDPFYTEKSVRNRRCQKALDSAAFKKALNHLEDLDQKTPSTLKDLKQFAIRTEIKRLLTLTAEKALWETPSPKRYTQDDVMKIFRYQISGTGEKKLFSFLGIDISNNKTETFHPKKILWLADESGEIIIDLYIIRSLTQLGHKVIIAFKDGPLYTKVDFDDIEDDESLQTAFENIQLVQEMDMSKNRLLTILRSDTHIFAISDGTRENINLLLASTTFARIFKEVDAVISRGSDQKRRFIDSHFQFTQDIFNIRRGTDDRSICIDYKPKHPSAIKFSHRMLEQKARKLIDRMIASKKKGMTVIFYSGIIGSIPGKIKIAKKIMAVFVAYLQKTSAKTFTINPSEYFEPGMDADDLMYMWEIVQQSGLIDIWRFQSTADIAKAFELMKKKVPPEWVGKDATFSTGCTKEMRIALEVVQKHPEMQIIGPSREKFIRRNEYGIGKMYDKRLSL